MDVMGLARGEYNLWALWVWIYCLIVWLIQDAAKVRLSACQDSSSQQAQEQPAVRPLPAAWQWSEVPGMTGMMTGMVRGGSASVSSSAARCSSLRCQQQTEAWHEAADHPCMHVAPLQVATHQLLIKFDIFGARSATLMNKRDQCQMKDTPLGAAAAALADGKLLDMQVS
jgi:hypothetical protein